jgi:hypothetical protein
MTTFKKKIKFKKICRGCKQEFMSADNNSVWCIACKTPRLCACGCGRIIKKFGRFNTILGSCQRRGKTYLELYNTDSPKCGFKKGENNVSKKQDIRLKISKRVKESYKKEELIIKRKQHLLKVMSERNSYMIWTKLNNHRGESFRSKLEMHVADLLFENNIKYINEFPVKMINGHTKWVDFKLIDYNILIEVTGFAYPSWRIDFVEKIKVLRKSTDAIIFILTYPEYADIEDEKNEVAYKHLYSACSEDVFVTSVFNSKRILDSINFFKFLLKQKELYERILGNSERV